MSYRLSQFWLTVVKPYYKDNSSEPLQDVSENVSEDVLEENHDQHAPEGNYDFDIIVVNVPQPQCSRSHPKGSWNCQHLINFKEQFIAVTENGVELLMAFITAKEKADFKLTKQLWKEGCITTPGAPF